MVAPVVGMLLLGLGSVTATASTGRSGAPRAAPRAIRLGVAPQPPAGAELLGPLGATRRLTLDVVLRPRNEQALAAFAAGVSSPNSASYRRYLRAGEFASRFGPTKAATATTIAGLRALGLSVRPNSRDGLSLAVSGSVRTIDRAFSTRLLRYRLASGRFTFSNTIAPLLTAGLAGSVSAIGGLSEFLRLQPVSLAARTQRTAARPQTELLDAPEASAPSACTGALNARTLFDEDDGFNAHDAADLASSYSFNSLYSGGDVGSGVTIALYELESDVGESADLTTFENCYGITTSVTNETVDGGPAGGGDGVETDLDIDVVSELAPSAHVIVYQGPNTTVGAYLTYQQIVDDDTAKVISTSWGACEVNIGFAGGEGASAESTLFQEAAAQGQTIVAASGDDGSSCGSSAPATLDPATQPYVTAVGGTALNSTNTAPPSETAWNDSGGGISQFWAMPSYQTNAAASLGVLSGQSSSAPCQADASGAAACREIPDVAADAYPNNGYLIYDYSDGHFSNAPGANWALIGGTSGAAPLWAAFIALADAATNCSGTSVGFLNPALYAIASTSKYSAGFSDVTSGSNGVYPAGTGYDMTTGLGTPIASGLAPLLCLPVVEAVVPDAAAPGSTITVRGGDLGGTQTVEFGGATAVPSSVASDGTSLTVIVPAAPVGSPTVAVTAVSGRGSSFSSNADRFTFGVPSFSALNVRAGQPGSSVVITGAGFTLATGVSFGGTAASFSVTSDTSITATAPAHASGTVAVQVINAEGSSPTTSGVTGGDLFTFGAPVVQSTGFAAGNAGAAVTVTGSGFANTTAVTFGGTNVTPTVHSDASLTVSAPSGLSGTVAITVSNAAGSSSPSQNDQFTYGPPIVSSFTPSRGPGGTTVTISGSGLANVTSVDFGSMAVAVNGSPSDISLTVTAPIPSALGAVALSVNNAAGPATPLPGDFTYEAAVPQVSAVTPSAGPLGGGTPVTISGSGFTAATGVAFGSTNVSFTVVSDATITAVTPPEGVATVGVVVTTAAGSNSASPAAQFSFLPQPVIASVTAGPSPGTVDVIGSGFSAATAVTFNGVASPQFVVDSPEEITAALPSGASGTLTVVVTTPGGVSPTAPSALFTVPPASVTTSSPATATPAAISAGASRLVTSLAAVEANGRADALITVDLRLTTGAPVAGKRIVLRAASGKSSIHTERAVTNSSGAARFRVSDATTQSVTFRATDTTDNLRIDQTALIHFVPVIASSRSASSTTASAPKLVACPSGWGRSSVSVTLRNAQHRVVALHVVTLSTTRGFKGTSLPSSRLTTATGVARFTISDPAAGRIVFTAHDATANTQLGTFTITFPKPRACGRH